MASGTQDTERIGASDPWAFQRWAFKQKTGTAARKAVLSMLATMVDVVAGRCEVKQATIAQGTEMSERRVRDHLAELERRGLIARRSQFRRDGRRRGDEFLLLAPWITEWPDGELVERVAPPDESTTGRFDRRSPASGHNRTPVSGQELPPTEQPPLTASLARGAVEDAGRELGEPNGATSDSQASRVLELLTARAERTELPPPSRAAVDTGIREHPEAEHLLAAHIVEASDVVDSVIGLWRSILSGDHDYPLEERLEELYERRAADETALEVW
jgi:DNA-binding transcriptional ArsR family regulator